MNILSDIISDYRSGLQMPILKRMFQRKTLWKPSLLPSLSAFLCSLAGQALGVWLLTVSQTDFFLVALVNALTFLLSSTILYLVRRRLTHDPVAISEKKSSSERRIEENVHIVQAHF